MDNDGYPIHERSTSAKDSEEREKWDSYYATLPVQEEDDALRGFNDEFVRLVSDLLPTGGEVLEAGCGGGWQSLALARSGMFRSTLMDFSSPALKYAQHLFDAEGHPAQFINGDVFASGDPSYDLVFNAGVLEHYSFEQQVAFLRGMASRSHRYVLALVPNQLCYWYWLWRVEKSSRGEWPFGKEVPMTDLSAAFRSAGIQYAGQAFVGAAWTEAFICTLPGIDEALRSQILEIHRSPLIPQAQKCYLVAALGFTGGPEPNLPSVWQQPQFHEDPMGKANATSALADALALRIGAEKELRTTRNRVAEADQALQNLSTQLEQKEDIVRQLSTQLDQREDAVRQLSTQLDQIMTCTGWRLLGVGWSIRLRLLPRQSLRERAAYVLARRLGLVRRQPGVSVNSAQPYHAPKKLRDLAWRASLAVRPIARATLPRSWRLRAVGVLRSHAGAQPGSIIGTDASSAPSSSTNPFGIPDSYDVVYLPIIEWEHRFQRPQQLATLFARDSHRVFYSRLTFHDHTAEIECQRRGERIFQLHLPGPPALDRFFEPLPHDAEERCLEAFDRLCLSAGIKDAVCVVELPFWTSLALRLRERYGWRVIFDCMDEHDGLTILQPEMLKDESRLAREADLVVVSSQKLWSKHSLHAPRCLMLRNAADFRHFSEPPDERPLAGVGHPIVGYYGAIMEWFDAEMVLQAAAARPNWSFVVIGKVDTPSVKPLYQLPNVHFLGEQPYLDLPAYLHEFDVCLIPFRLTSIIESTNPVKFYEYLSAGKPVVASPMPELIPYGDLFYPAADGQQLVSQIDKALREDSADRAAIRKEWARQQTWEERYSSLSSSISELHGRASIIIVSYGNLDRLKACIKSIIQKTHYPNYEVVVVDNGSTEDVTDFLRAVAAEDSRIRVVLNGENLGFARANNIGFEHVSKDAEYVVLLNNDTVVTRGWLSTLIRWLRDPAVGLVGPVTCPTGAANEAAIPISYRDLSEMESFAEEYTANHRRQSFDIPMLAMYCVAMRRSTMNEVGPLDEQFGIGMFEDDDYSLRIREGGFRIICAEDVFVHHVGRASFSRLDGHDYQRLFEENKGRFESKWTTAWNPPAARESLRQNVI